jgi:hypothetical protein
MVYFLFFFFQPCRDDWYDVRYRHKGVDRGIVNEFYDIRQKEKKKKEHIAFSIWRCLLLLYNYEFNLYTVYLLYMLMQQVPLLL